VQNQFLTIIVSINDDRLEQIDLVCKPFILR